MSVSSSPPSSPALSSGTDEFARLLETDLAAFEQLSEEEEEDEVESEEETEDVDDEELIREKRSKRLKVESTEVTASATSSAICPPHPGFMRGVCFRCGDLKPSSDQVESNVALKYIHEDFELAGDELARIRAEELEQVLGKKKLFLVLDLDHTMLNSALFREVTAKEMANIDKTYFSDSRPVSGAPAVVGPIEEGFDGLYRLDGMHIWTKLRPFAHQFLEEASRLFELYVYTMGERTYALGMAHLLDPTGKYFKGRVISQRDSTSRQIKDLDIVLGADSAVLILDDTEGVWPKHRANLIVMERYHFFQSSLDHFGLRSRSLAESQRDEAETEGALASVLTVLKKIHTDFFAETDGGLVNDVRDITSNVRYEILTGCRIIFSRIFPAQYPDPELHPLWRLATELGAECTLTLDASVTHVVGLDRGTEKAQWARQHRKFLVHPSWVEAAHALWRRPNESDFSIRDREKTETEPRVTYAKTVSVELTNR